MRLNSIILIFIMTVFIPISAQAQIIIASGAGYRSLVDDLTDSYSAKTGNKIELIYGNMSRVIAQARNSGAVDMVLGDKSFLDKAELDFNSQLVIGRGRLVIAYPKGKHFNGMNDLLSAEVSRIALPDTKRAIYGKAALQYLRSKKIYEKVEPKLLMVATVPQSASYVIAGEVDYAFINMTHARKIVKSIGGYTAVDESAYSPISILIGQMKNSASSRECSAFLKYLNSDAARRIVAAHGMSDK
ncbi:molybdate ABC transporter substrate-binding protein [Maridesulfovibrio hydrothermalis]|uniref:Molybdenum ABC transporter, periplasmic molybdate-binding protein n=1 Tax=Maridesulfovibrio hydrothermalis AM13 = DSM 14728 TaxID=1121451 RepID=L0R7K8_9BACT|nr:molybdate ABC transporter substrate-binding protein [Maridesulfovibrio hydrothermalis]CCO22713.1 Molybdenum ABC transporter, periplasmic molybdate-binding protein [Maridesulfovibrio hydrothermalis AM13 = DSM 14728]